VPGVHVPQPQMGGTGEVRPVVLFAGDLNELGGVLGDAALRAVTVDGNGHGDHSFWSG